MLAARSPSQIYSHKKWHHGAFRPAATLKDDWRRRKEENTTKAPKARVAPSEPQPRFSLSHSLTHSPCFLSDSEQRIKERRKSHRSLEKKIRQRSRIVFSLSSSYFQQFFLSLPLRRLEHLSLERVESRRWHFSSLIREYYPSSPSRETEENPLHARAAGDKRGTNSQ